MTIELIERLVILSVNAFSVFLIIVVLGNSTKTKLNRWFVIMTILITGWVDFAYLGITINNLDQSIAFYRLNLAFVSAFIFSSYYFLIECVLEIHKRIFRWVIFLISLLFVFLSFFTNTIVFDVVSKDWGNELVFGALNPFLSLFSGLIAFILLYYFISRYIAFSGERKAEIKYFLVGTVLLVVFNLIFNVFAPLLFETARFQNWGDYSAVIFLAFTAYSIVKDRFLGIKIILTASLISIIGMLLIIDIFFISNSLLEQAVKVVIFIFFVGISIVLVRSVLTEVRQKEELAKVNKELEESKALIQKKAEEQKDILDVLGHEIRTPLTAIIQRAKLLKRTVMLKREDILSGKLDFKSIVEDLTDLFNFVDIASISSTQMNETVSTSLEFARMDNVRFTPTFETFDLIPVISDAVKVMSEVAVKENSEISFNSSITKLEISADKVRIGEAVYSLLSNAIKYGKNPNNPINHITVHLDNANGYIDISVKDNGIGIAPEDISKLGIKFKRLADKTGGGLKRPGGTGLGLFVVKGIMEMHKGDLIIKSEGIGKGSNFILHFPTIKA